MWIVVIDFPCIFLNVFCIPPPNQENHGSKYISLKYVINTTLVDSLYNW